MVEDSSESTGLAAFARPGLGLDLAVSGELVSFMRETVELDTDPVHWQLPREGW